MIDIIGTLQSNIYKQFCKIRALFMRKKNDHWAQQEANLPQVCFISHKIPLKAKNTATFL